MRDRERFAALLGDRNDEERDRAAEEFREIIFEGMEGMPAARDMPDLVVSAANGLSHLHRSRHSSGMERRFNGTGTFFGIKQDRSHGHFPASALPWPFPPAPASTFAKGLDFVISIFNHSADWYAHPRVRSEYVEPPFEMTLTFADGTSQLQWCNDRLWNLYRGTSVGPYVLQSLLMALERWLLEFAECEPRELDSILLRILRRSSSAALTASRGECRDCIPARIW